MTAPFIRRRTLIAGGAGLALATVDRQGKPSLAWRMRNSRQQREAIQAARETVRQRYVTA